jgi:hypothetical protein
MIKRGKPHLRGAVLDAYDIIPTKEAKGYKLPFGAVFTDSIE